MLDWVLATRDPPLAAPASGERAIVVHGAGESQLLPLMNECVARYPQLKLFSLPSMVVDGRRRLELGFRGDTAVLDAAMADLVAGVEAGGFRWEPFTPETAVDDAAEGGTMTRGLGMDASGAWYDDVAVGDSFSRSVTVTDTHLVLGAGLIGDFNPHHTDDEYAKGTRFGTRILHGMLTSALMGAPVGHVFPRHRDRLSRAQRALQGARARRRYADRHAGPSPRATTSRGMAAAW